MARRNFIQTSVTMGTLASFPVQAPAIDKKSVVDVLTESKVKLEPIPDLLQQQEWEKVRQILKNPPVNRLWNLGDSQNPLISFAKESGDIELFELKDDLAYSLQLCDQLTYDNVFVYYQPGSGKFKIKEPQDLARKAAKQIDDILKVINEE